MARFSSSKGSRLTADERRLEQLHAETLQKQRELEKKLQRLPVQLAAQKEAQRKQDYQRAKDAGRPISSRPRGKGLRVRTRQMPSQQTWAAKRNTLILLLVLGLIVFLLWNVIPTN